MSEHITHIAVYEDSARIIKYSGKKITKAFHEAMADAYDCGLTCSGARGNHIYAIPIIEKAREAYGSPAFNMQMKEQLAGAIGWLLHRASDRQMKPLFAKVPELGNPMLYENECQMYHDAESYRQVYQGGKVSTKSPFELVDESTLSHRMEKNPSASKLNVDELENLMAFYFVSAIAGNCVFTEKLDDVNEFTDKLVEYSLDLYEDLRMYIRAYENPEPYKHHGYLTGFNIYDPEDELIRFVRYDQEHGEAHPEIELDVALEKAEKQSNYSQALRKGYLYTLALSDYFEEKISEDEVKERCEI